MDGSISTGSSISGTITTNSTVNGGNVSVGGGTSGQMSGGVKGEKGDGWTDGYYNSATGEVVFTSNDGLGFTTDDLRGYDPMTVSATAPTSPQIGDLWYQP